jgi:hypothetical protein
MAPIESSKPRPGARNNARLIIHLLREHVPRRGTDLDAEQMSLDTLLFDLPALARARKLQDYILQHARLTISNDQV